MVVLVEIPDLDLDLESLGVVLDLVHIIIGRYNHCSHCKTIKSVGHTE